MPPPSFSGYRTEFVGFRENDAERDSVLSEEVYKLEVDGLWLVAYVDEHKQVGHLMAVEHVRVDHRAQLLAGVFAPPCVAVAWEVDDIPAVVDQKMVYEHSFSGGRRSHGQAFSAGQHIDER